MSAEVEVPIGSIWRENDKRFERYVQVVELGESKGIRLGQPATESWAKIARCRPDGSWRSDRTTKARLRRFGKAYKRIKLGGEL